MRADKRGSGWRAALAVSAAGHAALVAVVVLAGRFAADRPRPSDPGIDTRVADGPRIEFHFSDVALDSLPTPVPPAPAPVPPPPAPDTPGEPPDPVPAVVEVAFTPTPLKPLNPITSPTTDPLVTPAVFAPSPGTGAAGPAPHTTDAGGPPLHGTLAAGRVVVYVLDASGSMGQGRKFDRARAALVSTLRQQPADVRFQVVVYAATARLLLPDPTGNGLPATAANASQVESALAAVRPAGRSSHLGGLRLALTRRPDRVLILTDADDLPTAALRAVAAQADRPASVAVARVGDAGPPVVSELK